MHICLKTVSRAEQTCSITTDKKMEKVTDSDSTPAMLASKAFNDILNKIQSSNLNFHLRISPFSAQISLRKTLVKDKDGAPLLSSTIPSTLSEDKTELVSKNRQLEQDVYNLSKNLTNVATENETLKDTVSERDAQPRKKIPNMPMKPVL